MREIKFRAWARNQDDSKGFVFGSLIVESDTSVAIQEHWTGKFWPCDDETVGQFTGLKDKNGVEIFEGDILQYPERIHFDEGGVVEYSHTGQYVTAQGSFKMSLHQMILNGWKPEVIGNVYENGDLLNDQKD